MVTIGIILATFVIAASCLHAAVRAWGRAEGGWWQSLAVLGLARLVSRSVALILPKDAVIQFGICFGVYWAAIALMLIIWMKVPAGRSLFVSFAVAVFVIVAMIVAVLFLPDKAAATSS